MKKNESEGFLFHVELNWGMVRGITCECER